MGKAPAFQMYASDFLVDVQGWTATEVGIYTRLLMNEWVNGRLPEEMDRLARISGVDLGNFLKCWRRVVGSKFSNNGSPGFVNNRLELEREKQDKYRELQSEKGKRGGRPLKNRSFSPVLTERKPEESSSSSSSSSSSNNKDKRIKHILPDVKIFIDFYYQEFQNQFGSPPLIQGSKDGLIIKRLLKTIPLKELQALLLKMFDSDDKFIRESGYTIGVFQSQINKLKIGSTKHPGLRSWGEEIMEEEDGRKG